jgi:hypothetical protein
MKSVAMVFGLLLWAALAPATLAQKTKPELLGVRLGMTEAEARARLDQIGRWEQEKEQRRDSVWELKDDKRFSHVAVGFDKKTRRVRYVTLFARAGGERVSPDEVLDLKRAESYTDPAGNRHYTERVRPRAKDSPAYVILAVGKDAASLTRLSVKVLEGAGAEEGAAKTKPRP